MPGDTHDSVKALMRARGLVDVLIPRGGAGLIRSVVEESTVPVIETGVGNCHVYVDASADLEQALAIVLNSKTHRTSVCNAAESLLVHEDVADEFLPTVVEALQASGVLIHGDSAFAEYDDVVPVTDEDHAAEPRPSRSPPPSSPTSRARSRTSAAGRRPHRGDPRPRPGDHPALRRRGRLRGGDGQRLHPLHRRW